MNIYTAAPDSLVYVVVVRMKVETIRTASLDEAAVLAEDFRRRGMDVTIFQEWDLAIVPGTQLLLPLEAESLKLTHANK